MVFKLTAKFGREIAQMGMHKAFDKVLSDFFHKNPVKIVRVKEVNLHYESTNEMGDLCRAVNS